jgi:hypothetical protein
MCKQGLVYLYRGLRCVVFRWVCWIWLLSYRGLIMCNMIFELLPCVELLPYEWALRCWVEPTGSPCYSIRSRVLTHLCLPIAFAVCRQPQQQLQLALNAWRKVTAVIKEQRLNPQPQGRGTSAGPPSSVGSGGALSSSSRRQVRHPWDLLPDEDEEQTPPKPPQQQQAAGSGHRPGEDAGDGEEEGHPLVHASLADYPRRPPWRHLVTTGDTLAPLGLLAPNEIQLAKKARDLRDLQGRFMVSDREQQPLGLATAALFAREAPPPGVLALARAQVPMTQVRGVGLAVPV